MCGSRVKLLIKTISRFLAVEEGAIMSFPMVIIGWEVHIGCEVLSFIVIEFRGIHHQMLEMHASRQVLVVIMLDGELGESQARYN